MSEKLWLHIDTVTWPWNVHVGLWFFTFYECWLNLYMATILNSLYQVISSLSHSMFLLGKLFTHCFRFIYDLFCSSSFFFACDNIFNSNQRYILAHNFIYFAMRSLAWQYPGVDRENTEGSDCIYSRTPTDCPTSAERASGQRVRNSVNVPVVCFVAGV